MVSGLFLRLGQRVYGSLVCGGVFNRAVLRPQLCIYTGTKYLTTASAAETTESVDDLIAAFVSSSETYARNDVLNRISRLSDDSKAVFSTRLSNTELSQDIKANIELQLLLGEKVADLDIFLFIVGNIHCAFTYDLLEVFAVRLVQAENLSAVVTLLHILSDKHPNFTLSNQSWSLLTSKVCEMGHYLGASLVYNEIIDPHKFYNTKEFSVLLRNSHVPFLVSPESLERLAMIFTHNGDSKAIHGLQDYFKRFYSYQGHSETYKALGICLIEALSKNGSFAEAIDSFRVLAYKFKGHENFKRFPVSRNLAKIRSSDHFKSERRHVRNNTPISPRFTIPEGYKTKLDRTQEQMDNSSSAVLFRPYEEQNVYSSPNKDYIAVIEGSLKVNDFSYFRELITANIKSLMLNEDSTQKIELLIHAITSVHSMLHPFVISSLCELGYVREAYTVLISLNRHFPKMIPIVLLREDSFTSLLHTIGRHLSEANIKLEELQLISNMVFDYYCEIANTNSQYRYSPRVFSCYISNLLSSGVVTLDRLMGVIETFSLKAKKPMVITLSTESASRFKQLYPSDAKPKVSVMVYDV